VSDETTVIAAAKPKRTYTEPTKSDYIIRCMAAENTVKAQDIELRQLRAQLNDAEEQAAKLLARVARMTVAAEVLAVIAVVLAFVLLSFLTGGAR
jgi:hypothetical protein